MANTSANLINDATIIPVRSFGEKIEGVEYFYRPGSYGLIILENSVGVVQSARSGKYFLVGGGHDPGESEIDALRREAREEIGFEIEVLEKIDAAIEYFYAANDCRYVAKECHFYRVRLLDKISETTESELVWIGKNRLGEMYHRSHQWIAERELKP